MAPLHASKAQRNRSGCAITCSYDRVKGARLHVSQRITRGDELIAVAGVEAVCITLDGRPRKPTAEMVAKLSPWFEG